jgi:hypothetical protein
LIKNIIISLAFAVSIASAPAFSATSKQDLEAIATLNTVNIADSEVALLQVAELSPNAAKSAVSQPPLELTEQNESALSTEWLFMIALFWFVILSNRRGV